MRVHAPTSLAIYVVLVAAAGTARADDPKYTFGKLEETKEVVWKAAINVGVLGTYGNSRSVTASGGFNVSRNDGKNKISLDALGAYSQSWTRGLSAPDSDGNGVIDGNELAVAQERASQLAAANWLGRLRYDRFFTPRNSAFLGAFVGQDIVAAKTIMTGGQIGYSRLLLHSEMNELAAEIGYDISYNRYSAENTPSTLVHSARLFLGYVLTIKKETALNASVEAFINGNTIDVGPPGDPNSHKGFAEASRVYGKLGLTTQIYKAIALKVGFTARYDNAPAPLDVKLPKGPTGSTLALAPGLALLRADRFDLLGEMSIVVTFL